LGYATPLVRRASQAEGATGNQSADARIVDASGSLGFEGQIIGNAFSTVLEIKRDIHPLRGRSRKLVEEGRKLCT
jgi:hypothetical protein